MAHITPDPPPLPAPICCLLQNSWGVKNWETKCETAAHLLSLGLQGTWQNNDGDMQEHRGDLHLTNWCLSLCRVVLMLEEDCHILVHCSAVIRQPDSQSSSFTTSAGPLRTGNGGGGWNESSNLQPSLGHNARADHLSWPPPPLFGRAFMHAIQTLAASSCPFIFFRGLQKWVWNHSLERLLIGVPGSVICN